MFNVVDIPNEACVIYGSEGSQLLINVTEAYTCIVLLVCVVNSQPNTQLSNTVMESSN